MKREMEKVIFESREEISQIEKALAEYAETHPDNEETGNVKELIEILDSMYLSI